MVDPPGILHLVTKRRGMFVFQVEVRIIHGIGFDGRKPPAKTAPHNSKAETKSDLHEAPVTNSKFGEPKGKAKGATIALAG